MDSVAVQIHRGMRVLEIVALCPAAVDTMATYGLHCAGCSVGGLETLEEGCRMHGYGDEEINALVTDLNETLASAPMRPMDLVVTLEAARGIRKVAADDGREGQGLAVIVDEFGGFCMEFRDGPDEGDRIFFHPDEPDVRVFSSPITLTRVGGGTIDLRDGRFKLDLPEVGCGCDGGSCACDR